MELQKYPPGLPSWPRWVLADDRRSCTVEGWHLKPTGAWLAERLAMLINLAIAIFLPWYYWGWTHLPPDWLRLFINFIGRACFHRYLTFEQRKWIYFGLWLAYLLTARLWRNLIERALWRVMRGHTRVTFTAAAITLPGKRVFQRSTVAQLSFHLEPLPDLDYRLQRAQGRGTVNLKQERVLYLQHGFDAIEVSRFAALADAERFLRVCLYSNTIAKELRGGGTTASGNDANNVREV